MEKTSKPPILADFFGKGFTHKCEDLEDLRRKYRMARRIRGSHLDRCIISPDGGESWVLYEYRGAV